MIRILVRKRMGKVIGYLANLTSSSALFSGTSMAFVKYHCYYCRSYGKTGENERSRLCHFRPKHKSWLNLVEMFFSKMTIAFLRSLRVASKDELKQRIEKYLEEVNAEPVVFKWKYKLAVVIV